MDLIDVRTLALAASISAGAFLLVPLMLMTVVDSEDDKSLRYWAAGGGALGLTSLTLALWGLQGNQLAITVGNTFAVLGMGWIYLASRYLLGLERGRRYVYAFTAATLTVGVILTYVVQETPLRVIILSFALATYPAMSAWLFVTRRRRLPAPLGLVTAGIFAAMSCVYIARTLSFASIALIDQITDAPVVVGALPFLIELVFNTWLAAMLAIVVSARIQARLRVERDLVAQANRELTILSTTDPLTGLANRNLVDNVLGVQSRRAASREVPLVVILLDIDHFKRVNDDLGHPIGDEVLVQLGHILTSQVRETDTVGRWGGEEFILVLPDTGTTEGLTIAERIRVAVASADFGIGRRVTASLGVSWYRPGDDAPALIKRADEALYEAKEAGRNRVRSV